MRDGRKKICFFIGDVTRTGGTERVATTLANRLVLTGKYDICFLSLMHQNEIPHFPIDSNIICYTLSDRKKWINPGPGYIPFLKKLRKFLIENEIETIVDIDIALDSLTIPVRRGLGVKVISWEHFNVLFERNCNYRSFIVRMTAKKSDHIVTLTKTDKNYYEKLLGRKENISCIYNPTNLEVEKCDPTLKNLIFVGRLTAQKGVDYLCRVLKKVMPMHPDWTIDILGDGPERTLIRNVIRTTDFGDRIRMHGTITDVYSYLTKSSIFVMTSRTEGLPMSLLEAKAVGLPIVSFDIATGPSEIVRDGVNGYLIPESDTDAMVERLSELMSDEKKRVSFSKNTVIDIDNFSIYSIAEQWEKLL